MHLVFQKCTNVQVLNLVVNSPEESPNTDGIHVTETENLLIKKSVIKAGRWEKRWWRKIFKHGLKSFLLSNTHFSRHLHYINFILLFFFQYPILNNESSFIIIFITKSFWINFFMSDIFNSLKHCWQIQIFMFFATYIFTCKSCFELSICFSKFVHILDYKYINNIWSGKCIPLEMKKRKECDI